MTHPFGIQEIVVIGGFIALVGWLIAAFAKTDD